jgi:hypothetical protein
VAFVQGSKVSRIDYPAPDTGWGKQNNVITKQAGGMMLRQVPTKAIPDELQHLLAEEKGTGA